MGDVIIKPLGKIETPDGPIYVTDVDGVNVHGGKPMTQEGREAISGIIEAATRYLTKHRATK